MGAIALFDLDGTITRRDTYLAYLLGFLARHPERVATRRTPALGGLLPPRRLAQQYLAQIDLPARGPRRRVTQAPRVVDRRFLNHVLSGGLRTGALPTMERHRAAGHGLVLVTASLDFYAEPLGQRLGFDTILCTRARYDAAGRLTGELDGANLYGAEKICYCDHHSDLPLVQFSDQAIAVNPTWRLRRTAERIGLPVEDWS